MAALTSPRQLVGQHLGTVGYTLGTAVIVHQLIERDRVRSEAGRHNPA